MDPSRWPCLQVRPCASVLGPARAPSPGGDISTLSKVEAKSLTTCASSENSLGCLSRASLNQTISPHRPWPVLRPGHHPGPNDRSASLSRQGLQEPPVSQPPDWPFTTWARLPLLCPRSPTAPRGMPRSLVAPSRAAPLFPSPAHPTPAPLASVEFINMPDMFPPSALALAILSA